MFPCPKYGPQTARIKIKQRDSTPIVNLKADVSLQTKSKREHIYHINCGVLQGFLALRKAVTAHMCLISPIS